MLKQKKLISVCQPCLWLLHEAIIHTKDQDKKLEDIKVEASLRAKIADSYVRSLPPREIIILLDYNGNYLLHSISIMMAYYYYSDYYFAILMKLHSLK